MRLRRIQNGNERELKFQCHFCEINSVHDATLGWFSYEAPPYRPALKVHRGGNVPLFLGSLAKRDLIRAQQTSERKGVFQRVSDGKVVVLLQY